eukprot:6212593-Pleurochrysis_carterae.AAC.2
MAIKSYLSDLWRVLDQLATWTWRDAAKTEGFGNATISRECAAVESQSRRYDAHHGISKNLAETLYQEDMVRYQVVYRERLVSILPSYIERLAEALDIDEANGLPVHCDSCPPGTDFQGCKTREVCSSCVSSPLEVWRLPQLMVGSRGFHRAETLNIVWGEFETVFSGISDFVTVAKNRYNGGVLEEKVNHMHSRYGPFCMPESKPLPRSGGAVEVEDTCAVKCTEANAWTTSHKLHVLKVLQGNLAAWLHSSNAFAQGTCVVCATIIFNCFANAAYWSQGHLLATTAARELATHTSAKAGAAATCATAASSSESIIPPPSCWITHSRPQSAKDYVMPIIKRVGRLRKGQESTIFDSVHVSFERGRLFSPSKTETDWAKTAFRKIWPLRPTRDGMRHVRITSDGTEIQVDPAKIVSHMKKRGATQNVAWLGAPMPITQALGKHKNVSTARMYQERTNVDLNSVRQILNAPPGLAPNSRVFSNLDVAHMVLASEHRTNAVVLQQSAQMSKMVFNFAKAAVTACFAASQGMQHSASLAQQIAARQSVEESGISEAAAYAVGQVAASAAQMQQLSESINNSLAEACAEQQRVADSHSGIMARVGTRTNPGTGGLNQHQQQATHGSSSAAIQAPEAAPWDLPDDVADGDHIDRDDHNDNGRDQQLSHGPSEQQPQPQLQPRARYLPPDGIIFTSNSTQPPPQQCYCGVPQSRMPLFTCLQPQQLHSAPPPSTQQQYAPSQQQQQQQGQLAPHISTSTRPPPQQLYSALYSAPPPSAQHNILSQQQQKQQGQLAPHINTSSRPPPQQLY